MNGTTPFPKGKWIDQHGRTFSTEMLEDKVTLVTILPCPDAPEEIATVEKIYAQFKETQKAIFIIFDSCSVYPLNSDTIRQGFFVFACKDSMSLCPSEIVGWPTQKSFALVDRDRTLRSFYNAGNDEEKRLLLEHMALLLPRDRSEKVELKRGSDK